MGPLDTPATCYYCARMIILNKIKSVILWFMRPKRYGHLYRTIREMRPRNVMEIGTWNGERAVKMLNLAGELRTPGDIHYYGFDLFEEMTPEIFEIEISKIPPTMAEVQAKLEQTGAEISLHQGDTTVTIPGLLDKLPQMDFVFLDGGHSVNTIASDWACVEKLMHDETVVIFDDYWEDNNTEGAKAIVDGIDRKLFNVEVLEPQDRFKKDWGTLKINFAKVTRKLGDQSDRA